MSSESGSSAVNSKLKLMCYKICANIVYALRKRSRKTMQKNNLMINSMTTTKRRLNPKLAETDVHQIIKAATDSFFMLKPSPSSSSVPVPVAAKKATGSLSPSSSFTSSSTATSLDKLFGADDPLPPPSSSAGAGASQLLLLRGNHLYEHTASCLNDLLRSILDRSSEPIGDALAHIFVHLEPWLTSVNDTDRYRALRSLASLLKYVHVLISSRSSRSSPALDVDADDADGEDYAQKLNTSALGDILSRVLTRCTDQRGQIRLCAIECVDSLWRLVQLFSIESSLASDTQVGDAAGAVAAAVGVGGGDDDARLVDIKAKLVKNEINLLLSAVSDLGKLFCKRVASGEQLVRFVDKLVDGLLDTQTSCSSAACLLLNYCIKLRGTELREHVVEMLLRHLYAKLASIQNPQAKVGALRTIRVVFQQHLTLSINVLLTFPIPCNK